VTGQAEWLRVLIRNLVDNAIRYTPLGGTVRVRVSRATGHCRLCVSDSGPGIPPADRDAVLRRFHRLDHGSQPGSGLGLAIVARIAELHGAELELAESENQQGLKVVVRWKIPA
jgi:two-component system sensor histidine kinase QseC